MSPPQIGRLGRLESRRDLAVEQREIFTDTPLVAGNNVLTVHVPVTAATDTYARFRVSTAGGLQPTGLAADGEVEDYRVEIAPSAAFSVKLINLTTEYRVAQGVRAATMWCWPVRDPG